MNEVVVFISLFAHASSTLFRQRGSFPTAMKVFSGDLCDAVRISHAPVAGRLYKKEEEEDVSWLTVLHHITETKFLSIQCFQTSTTKILFPFLISCLHTMSL